MKFIHNPLKIFVFFLTLLCGESYSQDETFVLSGTIKSIDSEPIGDVHIYFSINGTGTTSSHNGAFSITLPKKFPIELQISAIGWKSTTYKIKELPSASITIYLENEDNWIETVEIKSERVRNPHIQRIDPDFMRMLPTASGYNIEGLVRSQMGVTSNNELSSQYRVRGGSFDENLVYVNGQEVYRPFLIHSGQQEGLSFVNPDLVEAIDFSAGGFDAGFGDKMSSVLDIHYKKPKKSAGSASVGMLGANFHLEGSTLKNKFTWIAGTRYKTNRYLLGSLDESGVYKPNFYDVQAYFTYKAMPRLTLELLTYYSMNSYNFVPKTRATSFGTAKTNKLLRLWFEGSEQDNFQTGYGSFSLNFKKSDKTDYKLSLTGFRTYEESSYDIKSEYWIGEVIDPYAKKEEEKYLEEGIGSGLKHARNALVGSVASANLKASHITKIGIIEWGTTFQYEQFKDKIHEWEMIDSAFYSIPRHYEKIELSYFKYCSNRIENSRVSAFLKDKVSWNIGNGNMVIDAGIRGSYASFNDEFIISPRVLLTYLPQKGKNYRLRLSGGYYYQPPLVKEYRKHNGEPDKNLKSQKSIQVVSGIDYYFSMWERAFKFTSEAYYKKLDNLISYQIDNVRIIFSGINDAHGYAAGIDFKLNGQLVPGEESWITLSLMKIEEDLWNDFYINPDKEGTPGYIPRPSDQRFNISMFLQDNFKSFPELKAHLSIFWGSGLPYGPPNFPRYLATFRSKAYRRIDLGMSYDLLSITSVKNGFGRYLKNLWIGAEILNLIDFKNTISYSWINDIQGGQYAVPNYLTTRRINVSVTVKF